MDGSLHIFVLQEPHESELELSGPFLFSLYEDTCSSSHPRERFFDLAMSNLIFKAINEHGAISHPLSYRFGHTSSPVKPPTTVALFCSALVFSAFPCSVEESSFFSTLLPTNCREKGEHISLKLIDFSSYQFNIILTELIITRHKIQRTKLLVLNIGNSKHIITSVIKLYSCIL